MWSCFGVPGLAPELDPADMGEAGLGARGEVLDAREEGLEEPSRFDQEAVLAASTPCIVLLRRCRKLGWHGESK